MIQFYSARGKLDGAEEVFDESTHRDVVTWNSLISWSIFLEAPLVFEKIPERNE
ncbi:hypothetical protein MKW92_032836, partial [Papaver armeniacum]